MRGSWRKSSLPLRRNRRAESIPSKFAFCPVSRQGEGHTQSLLSKRSRALKLYIYIYIYIHTHTHTHIHTRVNQKVKAIFKLRGNRDRGELPRCAVLTTPVEDFSHVQYSALPSVEWQQRGRTWTLLCKIAPSNNNVA